MYYRTKLKQWEKDFIYLTYLTESHKDIAKILGRQKNTIANYVSRNKLHKPPKVKIGDRFTKLKVINRIGKIDTGYDIIWECECNCGQLTKASTSNLINNRKKSCGCYWYDVKCSNTKLVTGTFYCGIKHDASERNILFDVSIEYLDNLLLLQDNKCALSGIELNIPKGRLIGKRHLCTASVDRIDNSKGYIEGNVQFVYKNVNYMKWKLEQNEFIRICKLIAEKYK